MFRRRESRIGDCGQSETTTSQPGGAFRIVGFTVEQLENSGTDNRAKALLVNQKRAPLCLCQLTMRANVKVLLTLFPLP